MRNPVKLLFMALFFGSCSFSIFSGQIFTAEDADGNLISPWIKSKIIDASSVI